MKTYTIQKNQHDFRPRDGFGILPWFWLKNRALVVGVEFTESCLYDFGNDPDRQDWSFKLPGISLNPIWRPKNHKAAIVAARSNPGNGWMEVTAYWNHSGGEHRAERDNKSRADFFSSKTPGPIFKPGMRLVYIIYAESKNKFGIRLFKKGHYGKLSNLDALGNTSFFSWVDKDPWLYSPTGMWFGGADNDGNGIGGVAPQEMTVKINRAWVKINGLKKRNLI